MWDWLRRAFERSGDDQRQRLFETLDALNGEAGGGKPVVTSRSLGRLRLWSGTLCLGDPQCLPGLEIPNIAADEVAISASLWEYPSGAKAVTALKLRLGEPLASGARRKIGTVG